MITGLFIIVGVAGALVVGAGLLIREQLNRQDERIDTLLTYIDPFAYRKKKISEDLPNTEFRGVKKVQHDAVAEMFKKP